MTSSNASGAVTSFAGGICHHDFSLHAATFIAITFVIPATQVFSDMEASLPAVITGLVYLEVSGLC